MLALKAWLEQHLARVSGKAPLVDAIRYALYPWDGLVSPTMVASPPTEKPGLPSRAGVGVKHPVHALAHQRRVEGVERHVRISPRPKAVGESKKVNGAQQFGDRALDDFILQSRQWSDHVGRLFSAADPAVASVVGALGQLFSTLTRLLSSPLGLRSVSRQVQRSREQESGQLPSHRLETE